MRDTNSPVAADLQERARQWWEDNVLRSHNPKLIESLVTFVEQELAAALKSAESVNPAAPAWISVSEKLPTVGQVVAALICNGHYCLIEIQFQPVLPWSVGNPGNCHLMSGEEQAP